MKKILLIIGLICFCFAGCAPYVHLKWGDAEYESYGKHDLKNVSVTRQMPDGTKVSIKVESSETQEGEAIIKALDLAGEMVKKIP